MSPDFDISPSSIIALFAHSVIFTILHIFPVMWGKILGSSRQNLRYNPPLVHLRYGVCTFPAIAAHPSCRAVGEKQEVVDQG